MARFVPDAAYENGAMFLFLQSDEDGIEYTTARCPFRGFEGCRFDCALLTERQGIYYCGLNSGHSVRPLSNDPSDYESEER